MIKPIKKKILYENTWVRFHEDEVQFPDGSEGKYAYMDRVDSGPMIIPMTENGKIVVLKEWRYPIQGWTYCFPFGGKNNAEDIITAAQRELKEETGYVAKEWVSIGSIQIDPGANTQTTPIFVAKGLTQLEAHSDASEVHEVCEFSIEEIETMIQNGEMTNGWLLGGFAKLKLFLKS